jgi:DNA-binding MarR family transcriptional regulator
MEPMNEKLLQAWLRLTTSIVNSRIVPDMTYNESLVCNLLYNHSLHAADKLTATRLCQMTGMLKSQMNRTLNSLETRGVIVRERSTRDKRQVFVSMNPENCAEYIAQHQKILQAIDAMIDRIGAERAQQAIELFTLVSQNADSLMTAHE